MSDLEQMFADLEGCCLHDPQWRPADVQNVIAWVGSRQTGSESSAMIVVQLNDGQYGLLTESEDYTGHGCQCSSMTVKEPRFGALLQHLEDYELMELIQR